VPPWMTWAALALQVLIYFGTALCGDQGRASFTGPPFRTAPWTRSTPSWSLAIGYPACLRVPNLGVAFTERGPHSDRHTSEPAFPVGTLLAQYRSSI
jgi:hypothetical protein